MAKRRSQVTRPDVELFVKMREQIRQLRTDFEALSKKKPDGPVSKFKVAFINEKLREANRFVTGRFKPIEGFEEFDDVSLPSNSDVLMVIGQYLKCLERWRSANVHRERTRDMLSWRWLWNVKGDAIGADPSTAGTEPDDDDYEDEEEEEDGDNEEAEEDET